MQKLVMMAVGIVLFLLNKENAAIYFVFKIMIATYMGGFFYDCVG
jgi:hypothetical protein